MFVRQQCSKVKSITSAIGSLKTTPSVMVDCERARPDSEDLSFDDSPLTSIPVTPIALHSPSKKPNNKLNIYKTRGGRSPRSVQFHLWKNNRRCSQWRLGAWHRFTILALHTRLYLK